jgi:hypothetical protein
MFAARFKTPIGCFASLMFVTCLGHAQDRGTIRGTVTDPTGAAVPEAVIVARNVDTGLITRSPPRRPASGKPKLRISGWM